MKKKYFIILLILLVGFRLNSLAQSENAISFERNEKIVYVVIPFNLTEFSIESDQSLVLMPFIQSGEKTQILPSVVLNGDRQNQIGNGSGIQIYTLKKMSNRSNIIYRQEITYEPWMANASLRLIKTLFDTEGNALYTLAESLSNSLIHKGRTLPNSLIDNNMSTVGQQAQRIVIPSMQSTTTSAYQPQNTPVNTAVPTTQYIGQVTAENQALAEFSRIHSSGAVPLTQYQNNHSNYTPTQSRSSSDAIPPDAPISATELFGNRSQQTNHQYSPSNSYTPSYTPVQTQTVRVPSDIAPPDAPVSATELFGNRSQQTNHQYSTGNNYTPSHTPVQAQTVRVPSDIAPPDAPVSATELFGGNSQSAHNQYSYSAHMSTSNPSLQQHYSAVIPQPHVEGATYTTGNMSTTIYEMYLPAKKTMNVTDNSANMPVLENLFKKLNEINADNTQSLMSISIIAFTSVDDAYYDNEKLTQNQANAFKNYLQHHYHFPENYYRLGNVSEDWDGLVQLINRDQNMPNRYEALNIINTVDIFNGRELKLMQLANGIPYQYMKNNMFPYSRKVRCEIVYIKQ